MNTTSITNRLQRVQTAIRACERQYAREPDSVQLIAVSKKHPAAAIREANHSGQQDFGENYLQEALDKQAELSDLALCWHFIGPIQSNKTRDIATHFHWVHSVDREKIARRLHEQRPVDLPPLNVLLQVNISAEESKSGVTLDVLPELARVVAALPRLRLCGLMAIPAAGLSVAEQRQAFQQLARARDALQAAGHPDCRELSMGMSADMAAAIAEGATMVRIGTDIFGQRH